MPKTNLLRTTLVNFNSQLPAVIGAAIELIHCVLVRGNNRYYTTELMLVRIDKKVFFIENKKCTCCSGTQSELHKLKTSD